MARVSAFPKAPEQWLPLWLAIYRDDSCFIALALCVASWIERHFFEFASTFGIGLSLGTSPHWKVWAPSRVSWSLTLYPTPVCSAWGGNFNITTAWNSAKSRSPLAPVLRELFCIQEQRQVSIGTRWVRREDNEVADRLSKGLLEEAISLLGKPHWIRRPFPPEIHRIADRAVVCAKSIAEFRDRPDTSGVRPVELSLALRRAELE
jgi:hypothetical protein